jgi:peptide/nickel transport system substrate-binding protein
VFSNLRTIGLAVVLSAAAVAGCGGSDDSGSDGAARDTREGGGPTAMTVAFAAVPGSLDTAAWEGQSSNETLGTFGQGITLLRLKPASRAVQPPEIPPMPDVADLQPGLAEAWEQDEDGDVTITLRDAKSARGNTLTSEDVKWSFERSAAIVPVTQFLYANASIDAKKPVTVIDDKRLRINTDRFNPQTLVTLTFGYLRIHDSTEVKKHTTKDDPWAKEWLTSNSADFGAWNADSFQPNSELRLSANPSYWGGAPDIDQVVVRAIPEPGNRLQLLQSGTADLTSYLNYDQFEGLQSAEGVKRVSQPVSGADTLSLDFDHEAFGDVRVRKAISMALDREAIVEGVYKGFGRPAADQLPSTIPHPELPTDESFQYDVERAKALLAEAGFADGFEFTLLVSPSRPGPYSSQIGLLLQSQLKAIGIDVKIQNVASAADYQDTAASGDAEAFLYATGGLTNDPGFFMNVWHDSANGLQNYKGYENPEFNELVTEINSTPLGAERDELVRQANEIMNRDVVWVPLVEPTIPYAFSARTDIDELNIYGGSVVGMALDELSIGAS